MLLTHTLTPPDAARMRGTVDVYVSRGQIIARQWPRHPRQPNTPKQIQTREAMAQAQTWIRALPEQVKLDWQVLPYPPTLSWVCWLRSLGLQHAYGGTLQPVPQWLSVTPTPDSPPGQTTIDVTYVPSSTLTPEDWTPVLQPRVPLGPTIDWYISPGARCRDGVKRPFWRPVTSNYLPHLTYTPNAPASSFEVVFPGIIGSSNFAIAPSSASLPPRFLTPPYRIE